jgi:uncharacterized protein
MTSQPDFERARRYALKRLESELPSNLLYHSVAHTRDDVLPAAERLAAMEGVEGEDLLLLRTAVLFHDIGFVEQGTNHEGIGARVAAQVLPSFGYQPEQIEVIKAIIMATELPQSPHTLLEKIMADADLDVLGRKDFLSKNQALRAELNHSGTQPSDEEWFSSQLEFLHEHRYFTAAARTLRSKGKQKNIERFGKLFAQRRYADRPSSTSEFGR